MAEPAAGVAEPMPFRLLLDEAGRAMRRHFRRLYLPVAVPLAAANLALMLFNVLWSRDLLAADAAADPAAMVTWWGGLMLGIVALLILQTLAYGAMGAGAVDVVAGRPISMQARWRFALRPRVSLSILGMGLAAAVGMACCCILPGVYLLLLWGFLVPVMAEEGLTLGPAFGRAADLARYNPHRRLGTSPMIKLLVLLVVGYILSFVASLTVQLPFTAAQQGLMVRDLFGSEGAAAADPFRWQWLQVPAAVAGSLAQTAVVVYLSLGTALLYFDVRGRREGRDLEAVLDELLGPEAADPAAGPAGPGEAGP